MMISQSYLSSYKISCYAMGLPNLVRFLYIMSLLYKYMEFLN